MAIACHNMHCTCGIEDIRVNSTRQLQLSVHTSIQSPFCHLLKENRDIQCTYKLRNFLILFSQNSELSHTFFGNSELSHAFLWNFAFIFLSLDFLILFSGNFLFRTFSCFSVDYQIPFSKSLELSHASKMS